MSDLDFVTNPTCTSCTHRTYKGANGENLSGRLPTISL
uniref:Uncharacterized protein n=1 Tax=Rhizophora mucronata TaxID=61149 RepID=A0A2P2QD36_RHIMU